MNNQRLISRKVIQHWYNDHCILSFQLDRPGKAGIAIYSLSGQVLKTIQIDGNAGTNDIRIAALELPVGIMPVRIQSGKQVSYYRLIHVSK